MDCVAYEVSADCIAERSPVATGFLASRLNHLGATHWKKFATQDYFDKGGFFISVMVSLPSAVIAVGIVVLRGSFRDGS
jgi:hypothetical protein